MNDPIACDYHYKCLSEDCIKYSAVPCPYIQECALHAKVRKFIKKRYVKCSYLRGKNGWDHGNIKQQDVRDLFIERLQDGFRCAYCGQSMTMDPDYANSVTLDHITARGLGGDNSKDNLILCCYECNQKKSVKEGQLAMAKQDGIEVKIK